MMGEPAYEQATVVALAFQVAHRAAMQVRTALLEEASVGHLHD
jgi:hypothetical protein